MAYEIAIKDKAGADLGKATLEPEALGGKVRTRLLQEACVMYEANRRVGTHCTKTRADLISFSNRKPWRQKGTGRARAGTRRSPLWRKGGTIFGPKPRDYSYSMPQKSRRRAVQSALLSKFRDGEALIVDDLAIAEPKTKQVRALLSALGLVDGTVLVVTAKYDELFWRAARNIAKLAVLPVAELNAYEVLRAHRVLLSREAYEAALKVYSDEAVKTRKAEAEA